MVFPHTKFILANNLNRRELNHKLCNKVTSKTWQIAAILSKAYIFGRMI